MTVFVSLSLDPIPDARPQLISECTLRGLTRTGLVEIEEDSNYRERLNCSCSAGGGSRNTNANEKPKH
jgi:hypothetical protein